MKGIASILGSVVFVCVSYFLVVPVLSVAMEGAQLTEQEQLQINKELRNAIVINSKLEFVEQLLKKGAQPNDVSECGYSAVHRAVQYGRPKILTLLLGYGADIDKQTNAGETPLHKVVATIDKTAGHFKLVRILLERGADVQLADSKGNTPLHRAVSKMFEPTAMPEDLDVLQSLIGVPSCRIVNQAKERAFCMLCCLCTFQDKTIKQKKVPQKDVRKLLWERVMIQEIVSLQLGLLVQLFQQKNKEDVTPMQLAQKCAQKTRKEYQEVVNLYPQTKQCVQEVFNLAKSIQAILNSDTVEECSTLIMVEVKKITRRQLQKK